MASRLPFLLAALACGVVATAHADSTMAVPLERAVQAPGPSGPLRGWFLQVRKGNAPLALIVPGSGPTDRDGNSPAGLKSASYKLLAEGLAARGISVARVDKRGMFASAQAVPDANAVTLQDYATDVRAWARELRRGTGAHCTWVIGHSEGGLVALLAGDDEPAICGAILLAAPGRPLGRILREQLQSNPANQPLLDAASRILDALEAGRHVDAADIPPPLLPLFHPRVQAFLIGAMALDPAGLVARYRKPVLLLQGERDLQVSVQDAMALARAAPAAELVLLPGTNHVLKLVAGDDRSANLASYADPSLPIADGVVRSIADFIQRHTER